MDDRCPCCNGPSRPGLFTRIADLSLPDAVARLREAGIEAPTMSDGDVLACGQRFFIRCHGALPLGFITPVRARLYVEVTVETALAYGRYRDSQFEGEMVGEGWLACDFPGYPGSAGAAAQFTASTPKQTPNLLSVSDDRLYAAERPNHEELAKLYRRVWSGPDRVPSADRRLREKTLAAAETLAGGWVQRVEQAVPPGLAGAAEPPYLAMRPPRDTGGEAFLLTVGNAEGGTRSQAVEFLCCVRDPSPSFVASFGEFAYWSRSHRAQLRHGSVVSEPTTPIVSTPDKVAWLLARPWWLPETQHDLDLDGQTIELYTAVPITKGELQFAHQVGGAELASYLERNEVDVFDLGRPSAF